MPIRWTTIQYTGGPLDGREARYPQGEIQSCLGKDVPHDEALGAEADTQAVYRFDATVGQDGTLRGTYITSRANPVWRDDCRKRLDGGAQSPAN